MAVIATEVVSVVPDFGNFRRRFRPQLARETAGSRIKLGVAVDHARLKAAGKAIAASLTAAVAGAGIAAGKLFADSIAAASDLNETSSKVNVLFGNNAKAVQAFAAQAAKSMGQSRKSVLDGASTFAIYGKQAKLSAKQLVPFSTGLTSLASDMASFSNTSPQEAIDAIGSAMRGEMDPIEKYGVLLNESSLKAIALKKGLIETTKQALTPQQRVIAVQAALYEQLGKAGSNTIGDFARTSGGLANQQRTLAANWENMKAQLGEGLLPVVTRFTTQLNDKVMPALTAMWQKHGPAVVKFLTGMGDKVTAVVTKLVNGDFDGILRGVGDAFGTLRDVGRNIVGPLFGALKSVDYGAIGDGLRRISEGVGKAIKWGVDHPAAVATIVGLLAAYKGLKGKSGGVLTFALGGEPGGGLLKAISTILDARNTKRHRAVIERELGSILTAIRSCCALGGAGGGGGKGGKGGAGAPVIVPDGPGGRPTPRGGRFGRIGAGLKGVAGKVGKGGIIGTVAALAADPLIDLIAGETKKGTGKGAAVGAAKGAVQGAGTGALLGSIVPGVGTAIGAGVGGIIGAGAGAISGGGWWPAIEKFFKELPGKVVGWLKGVWTSLSTWFTNLTANIGTWFSNAWTGALTFLQSLPGRIVGFLAALPTMLADFAGQLVGWIIVGIVRGIPALWGYFKTLVGYFGTLMVWVGAKISAGVSAAMTFFASIPGRVWGYIKGVAGIVWNGIKAIPGLFSTMVTGALEWVRTMPGKVWEFIKSLPDKFTAAVSGVPAIFSGMWDAIKGFFVRGTNGAIDLLNSFVGGINKVITKFGLDEIPTIHHIGEQPPRSNMPDTKRARGGVIPGFSPNARADNIPAWLTAGEYVQPLDTVRYYGKDFMDRLRRKEVPRFAGGGLIGGLTDLASPKGPGLINDLVRGIWDKIPGPMDILAKLVGNLAGLEAPGYSGPIPKGLGAVKGINANVLGAAVAAHAKFGTTVSSGRRNTTTVTGNASLHNFGRAIDMVPPSMALFNFLAAAYPMAAELIYSPANGRQIWKGKPHMYSGKVRAQHWDHVHLALARGGLVPARSYDSGGWLMPGLQLAYNGTGRPERVTKPGENVPGATVRLDQRDIAMLAQFIVGATGNSAIVMDGRRVAEQVNAYAYMPRGVR